MGARDPGTGTVAITTAVVNVFGEGTGISAKVRIPVVTR